MRLGLTVLSALEVLVFAGALLYYLRRIADTLDSIGGTPNSSLARTAMGVRAIERETSHLGPQVTQLNAGLGAVAEQLHRVDAHLGAAARTMAKS